MLFSRTFFFLLFSLSSSCYSDVIRVYSGGNFERIVNERAASIWARFAIISTVDAVVAAYQRALISLKWFFLFAVLSFSWPPPLPKRLSGPFAAHFTCSQSLYFSFHRGELFRYTKKAPKLRFYRFITWWRYEWKLARFVRKIRHRRSCFSPSFIHKFLAPDPILTRLCFSRLTSREFHRAYSGLNGVHSIGYATIIITQTRSNDRVSVSMSRAVFGNFCTYFSSLRCSNNKHVRGVEK